MLKSAITAFFNVKTKQFKLTDVINTYLYK